MLASSASRNTPGKLKIAPEFLAWASFQVVDSTDSTESSIHVRGRFLSWNGEGAAVFGSMYHAGSGRVFRAAVKRVLQHHADMDCQRTPLDPDLSRPVSLVLSSRPPSP